MNYHFIEHASIANGKGVRVVLWISGCSIHCCGCHNPEAWDINSGRLFNEDSKRELLKALDHSYIQGLTLSGGNPLEPQNLPELYSLIKEIKEKYPQKDIWCYTGFTFEELIKNEQQKELLSMIDVLVDGPFDQTKRDITLQFKGSSNQRIIRAKESIERKEIVYWEQYQ